MPLLPSTARRGLPPGFPRDCLSGCWVRLPACGFARIDGASPNLAESEPNRR